MRAVLQRVQEASVTVDSQIIGSIGYGLLILLAIGPDDNETTAQQIAEKAANLRIFNDESGKFQRSLLDVGGSALVVSQFTLYADVRRGRRPSFSKAAMPDRASDLVNIYCDSLRQLGVRVETGEFGAMMQVALINDGPVTIWLDSADL